MVFRRLTRRGPLPCLQNESPDAGCGRCEGNGFGPIHIYFSEFLQWIARGLTHHVNAGRQVHNNGCAGERISQFRIRAQIAQKGNLTQSRIACCSSGQVLRSRIPAIGRNPDATRLRQTYLPTNPFAPVTNTRSFMPAHQETYCSLPPFNRQPIGRAYLSYIPCFQTQSLHHSSHSNGLVVTLDEGLASVMSLFPDLFRMLKEVHEQ